MVVDPVEDGVLGAIVPEQLMPTESRVPTRLIDRSQLAGHKCDVRVIKNGTVALFRVGPYDVLRGLVRAPCAWLVEARGPNGEAVLLQLAHLRRADDGVELLDRQRLEQRVAKATAALFAETDIPILAHGAADREDETRVLFWAMPWREGAERLVSSAMYVEGIEHLVRIGADLALRLATRHILGGFEPLLSEHLVLVSSSGGELVGVPVPVTPRWLAPDMPAPRLAPEETNDGRPTKSGDLWRLGHTLLGLAPDFDALPESLRTLVQNLASMSPERRPPRATEVLVELEAIYAEVAPDRPPLELAGSETIPVSQIAPNGILDVVAATLAIRTRVETTTVPGGETPTLQDLPPVIVGEAETIDACPPWAFFFRPDELQEFLTTVKDDLDRRELVHDFGTGVVQIATPDGGAFCYLGLGDLARTCHRAPRTSWPAMIREDFDKLLEATARDPDVGTPLDFEIEPSPLADLKTRHDSLDGVLKTEPYSAELIEEIRSAEPVPIIVGRPSTEDTPMASVVVIERTRPPLDGLPTEQMPPVVAPPAPPAPLIDGTDAELDPELEALATNRHTKRAVLAGFLVLLSLGGAAWLVRNADLLGNVVEGEPATSAPLVATPANAVRIEATPSGTVVVSERDGRILGAVPVDLIVPPGRDLAVLVAAKGHEPQRLVLPVRGRISTRLSPLPEDAPPCAIDLDARSTERFEGVGAELKWGNRLAVRGAAVVRARDDTGAWLVRCPSFGGGDRVELERPPLEEIPIEVTGPVGWSLSIDGDDAGVVPGAVTVRSAFVRVSVKNGTRQFETWIPTAHAAKFELPAPADEPAPRQAPRISKRRGRQ